MLWSRQVEAVAEADVSATPGPGNLGKSAPKAGKKKRKEYPLKYKYEKVSDHAAIVEMAELNCLYISGFCEVTLLEGAASLGNYHLKLNDKLSINAPCWTPAWRLVSLGLSGSDCSSSSSVSKACKVLVEAIPRNMQEWLVLIEDQDIYKSPCQPSQLIWQSENSQIPLFVCTLGSAMVGCEAGVRSMNIEGYSVTADWEGSLADIKTSFTETKDDSSIMICGAKGVGKSAYLKHAINSLLSVTNAVCVIDFDCGQPEFGCPGTFSLHIVDEPCHSPCHLNLQRPVVSYFSGEVSSKASADFVFTIIQLLFDKYRAFVAAMETIGRQQALKAIEAINDSNKLKRIKKELFCNRFDSLDQSNQDAGTEVLCDENSFLDSYAASAKIPVVINCDGFIRYFGAEVLHQIATVFKPAAVVHISSAKDKELAVVEYMRTEGAKIYTLEPGRATPSRITAVDMRNLRFISYFLRFNSLMGKICSLLENPRAEVTDDSIAQQYEHLLLAIRTAALQNRPGYVSLSIKNGNICDNFGIISLVLQSVDCQIAPFESVILSGGASPVPPELVFSSVNASLVSISSALDCSSISCKLGLPNFDDEVRGEGNDLSSNDTGNILEFTLNVLENHSQSMPVSPSISLGIVKAIDLFSQCIMIICPDANGDSYFRRELKEMCPASLHRHVVLQFTAEESHPDRVMLVKGNIQLPGTMGYSVCSPAHPFYCGESLGEGASEMKARRVVKRRSHHTS